jgi:ribonucleoside-diphosphate reductase beta chain
MSNGIYNPDDTTHHLNKRLVLDPTGGVSVQRFDSVKYPWIDKHNDHGIGLFWRPEDINLTKDTNDFQTASPEVQHIFTSNLLRQIMLDSLQSRAPIGVLGSVITEAAAESYTYTWAFFEAIHSRSYTHIIRNVYPDPSVIFDQVNTIPEIRTAARSIAKYYDELGMWNDLRNLSQGQDTVHGADISIGREGLVYAASLAAAAAYNEYEHKKAVWRALNAANALESIRFVVSFACAFAMEKNSIMEGNASIMSMIFRDERGHYAFTRFLLNKIALEDPDFARIKIELADEIRGLYLTVMNEEKSWSKYLFNKGAFLGLTDDMLCSYIDWLGAGTAKEIDLEWYEPVPAMNPLPWMDEKASHGNKQKALQEADNDAYLVGIIDNSDDDILDYVGTHSKQVRARTNRAPKLEAPPVVVLTVYSKENCPQCTGLKQYLDKNNVPHRVLMLNTDFILSELVGKHEEAQVAAPRSFPVVWADDTYVGGMVEVSRRLAGVVG